ncbi:MAG TPA: hypothetical protein VNU46_09125 [Gemmatimonadaceae bacterium]|jgi:hypothetical protein|nr:hypothetical protein [Gemmatimonadaceae bacterium]
MPNRTITVEGTAWHVVPSGRVTQYDLDEFALIFTHGEGEGRQTRVTRYSPVGARSREQSFAELTDTQLHELLRQSQPGLTSPEARYTR